METREDTNSRLMFSKHLPWAACSSAAFADNEGKHPDRWNRLAAELDKLLFRWSPGCIEENVVAAVAHDKLQALIEDPVAENDKTGERLRTLADRLDIAAKDFETIQAKAGSSLKGLIIAATLVYRS